MKDSLPTRLNLKAQYVPVDDVCEGCIDYVELTLHFLWICDQARAIWLSNPEFLFLVQLSCKSFVELLEALFRDGLSFKVALFATVAWCLWQQRNQMRERQPSWQLHEIGNRARVMVREFWEANK